VGAFNFRVGILCFWCFIFLCPVAGYAKRFTTYDKPSKHYLSFVKNISERLQHAIRFSGHSKGALAEHIGVPQSSVSRWLAGSEPRSDRLFEIAKFLNVDVKWLMTGEGRMEPEKLSENAESYANPNESGIGESAQVVREDAPMYGARTPLSHEEEMRLLFGKVREVIDLLEKIAIKGPRL
jgi:transcriptional regulator with XRE-family HTH domain